MPAFTLTPTSQGTNDTWILAAGGSKPTACAANDGDGAYIRTDADNTDSFVMTDLPADAASISGSVTFKISAQDRNNIGGLTVYTYAYHSGSGSSPSSHTPTGSWADYSGSLASVPGGSGWTVANVNACEAGVTSGGGGNRIACSYVEMSGTYLQAGETFVSIYNLVGPALFGSSLALPDLIAAAGRALYYRGTKLIYSPQEIAQAWAEYKLHKFPTYHFQGAH